MSINGLPLSIVQGRPHATPKDSVAVPSGSSSQASPCKSVRVRRSWYSQTFEDDESDYGGFAWERMEHSGCSTSATATLGPCEPAQETFDVDNPVISSVPSRDCHTDENVSEASTDVGSDDEDGGKRLDDLENRPSESAPLRQRKDVPRLQGDTLADHQDEAPRYRKDPDAEELAAMEQRRLLKKQRQRDQRRDLRIQERAQRSDRRRRS